MKIRIIAIAIASTLAMQAQAGTSLDFRQGYTTGSEKYQSRVLLTHELDSGLGGSIEYTINNSSKSAAGYDQALWNDTEFQLYYKYKLNNQITLIPSFLVDTIKDKGEVYKFGMQANWAFAPTWRADARVRYENKNYDATDLSGQLDNDHTTRTEFWLRKQFDSKLDAYYNFRWDHKLNNFEYVNQSRNYYEHNVQVGYKFAPSVRSYLEVGYLGETANKNQDDEWRIRAGLTYSF